MCSLVSKITGEKTHIVVVSDTDKVFEMRTKKRNLLKILGIETEKLYYDVDSMRYEKLTPEADIQDVLLVEETRVVFLKSSRIK